MTFEKNKPEKQKLPLLVPLLSAVVAAEFMLNAKEVATNVNATLLLCVKNVIPAVFPCMAASGVFVAAGGAEVVGKVFGRICEKIFRLPKVLTAAIILGMLCGFPVGALTAGELYRRGDIEKSELERVIGFCSLPSPAFVINTVGGKLGGGSGIFLFILLVCASVITGVVSGLFCGKKVQAGRIENTENTLSLSEAVATSLYSSALSCLKICACAVFFSALCAPLPKGTLPTVLIHGIFEFSGGCAEAADFFPREALPLCALFLGWSGFSVHFQIASVCPDRISFKKYYIMMTLRGIACFLCALAVTLAGFDI